MGSIRLAISQVGQSRPNAQMPKPHEGGSRKQRQSSLATHAEGVPGWHICKNLSTGMLLSFARCVDWASGLTSPLVCTSTGMKPPCTSTGMKPPPSDIESESCMLRLSSSNLGTLAVSPSEASFGTTTLFVSLPGLWVQLKLRTDRTPKYSLGFIFINSLMRR